jgi:hypothetical protein
MMKTNTLNNRFVNFIFTAVTAVGISLTSAAIQAQTVKYKIEIEISRDGKLERKMAIENEAGKESTIKIGEDKQADLKLSIMANAAEGDQVPLELKIEMRQADDKVTTSNQKIKTKLGVTTNVGVETDSGADIEFSFKVTKS